MSGLPVDSGVARFLEAFRARHASAVVRDALAALRPLKVLVIGEAIIDEYSYCVPLGKAPKEPVISAKHVRLERQAGGPSPAPTTRTSCSRTSKQRCPRMTSSSSPTTATAFSRRAPLTCSPRAPATWP